MNGLPPPEKRLDVRQVEALERIADSLNQQLLNCPNCGWNYGWKTKKETEPFVDIPQSIGDPWQRPKDWSGSFGVPIQGDVAGESWQIGDHEFDEMCEKIREQRLAAHKSYKNEEVEEW